MFSDAAIYVQDVPSEEVAVRVAPFFETATNIPNSAAHTTDVHAFELILAELVHVTPSLDTATRLAETATNVDNSFE